MSVRFIPCGEFVNESERIAVERLRAKLQSAEAFWILLSNLNHSAQPGSRSDEIDLIAIGPPGVYVIFQPEPVDRCAEHLRRRRRFRRDDALCRARTAHRRVGRSNRAL